MKSKITFLVALLMFTMGFSQTSTFTSTPVTSVTEGTVYNYVLTTNANAANVVTATALPAWLTLQQVSTLAGSGTAGSLNGTGTNAQFNSPTNVALDASGNLYVADQVNQRIRKITPAGVVSTLAGNGTAGFINATGTSAEFNFPTGVTVDASGTILYVADQGNNSIRKIVIATGVVTTLAGGTQGFADATGTAAQFNNPQGVTVDASGNVYVADTNNQRIRKITSTGVVTTLAGNGTNAFLDGTGTAAEFFSPSGVAIDASGNLYVADL